jgi:integrase
MVALTQALVDSIPLDKDGVTWDDAAPGLGLRVQRGRRSWVIRYRVGGAQRQKSLQGDLELAKARKQAAAIRTAATVDGVDRVAEGRAKAAAARKAEVEARRAAQRRLGRLVEDYLAGPAAKLAPRTLVEVKRYLEEAWRPLHDHDPERLERREIVTELERIARERGPIASNRARAYLSMALTYGVERGLIERNACIGIKRLEPERPRDRVLSADELRSVWNAADPSTDYGAIVRLLLLTAQRREEVGAMAWSEIEPARQLWHLPASRTKNGLPHDVPLSQQAMTLIEGRERRVGRDLIFGNGQGPFSAWSQSKERLDARIAASGVALPPWTVHDVRRSVVTNLAEIGIAPHVIEAVVNHISGHKAGVAGVYNRATYAAEKRAALQRWADHVEALVAGEPAGNVVAFGR